MEAATTIERHAVQLTELHVHPQVTLVQMPDMVTFDLHVYGDAQYLVHFVNPNVFGMEFAVIRKGYNLFTQIKIGEETACYLFDKLELKSQPFVTELKCLMLAASPCTPPIIIPPRPSPK